MLRKWFLVPVLASLAFLFVAVDVAQAQLLRGRLTTVRERRMERRDARRGVLTRTEEGPSIQQTGSLARVSYYPTPASVGLADAARIRVILPDAQARVFFGDAATKQVGTDRLFYTPPLTAGTANEYRIRATFMRRGVEVTQVRDISVLPGQTYELDFTRR